MPIQSFAAVPVPDATNALRNLAAQATTLLNPALKSRSRSELAWLPKTDQLYWTGLQLTKPLLTTARDTSGDFLLAKIFPPDEKTVPVSDQLWKQFENRSDLVYYDWEFTGLRLFQWRLLSELLPVFPPPTQTDIPRRNQIFIHLSTRPPNAICDTWLAAMKKPFPPRATFERQLVTATDDWLSVMTPFLDNTVTEVTCVSPTELRVERNSQFLFTGLELVLFSHWLADTTVGPLDYRLLPMAKVSPGLPKSH
jgi:hypothetical protein